MENKMEHRDIIAEAEELKKGGIDCKVGLPDHKFTDWQQEAYNQIMSGQNAVIHRGIAVGKTYLYEAIKEDMAIIQARIDEHFIGE